MTEKTLERIPGTNISRGNHGRLLGYRDRLERAFRGLTKLNSGQDRRNVHQRLAAYRILTEDLMDAYEAVNETMRGLAAEREQLTGGAGAAHRKQWTDEQDELLVEMACQPDSTALGLALSFGRTPAAISSRLTYLVGVSKVSRHIVGRITGYLDGELVSGFLDAELR